MSTARPRCHGCRLANNPPVCGQSGLLGGGRYNLTDTFSFWRMLQSSPPDFFRRLYHQDNSRPQYASFASSALPRLSTKKPSLKTRPTGTHLLALPPGSRLLTVRTYTPAHMNTRSRHAMDEFDQLLGVQSPSSCLSSMYQEPEPYLDSSNTTASTSPSESPVGSPFRRRATALPRASWLTSRRPVRSRV